MKKIKVLYIAVGGIYGSDKALLNMLENFPNNIDPYVIVQENEMGLAEELSKNNINYKKIKFRYNVYPPLNTYKDFFMFLPRLVKTMVRNYIATTEVTKIAIDIKADIIHTNTSMFDIGIRAAAKLKRIHVWHFREYAEISFKIKYIFPINWLCSRIANTLNYTISITKGIQEYYNINSQSCVLYDGVRSKMLRTKDYEKQKYFLFVGAIAKNKGIDEAVNAFIEFCKDNFEYKMLIAGRGDSLLENTLNCNILKAKLEDRIIFLGHISDIDSLMNKATALIVSSHSEGFGFITAEAMFNKCLVIGKDNTGTKEQFNNGLNYSGSEIGIRYNTPNELVEAMKEVVKNGLSHYDLMIVNAQKTVLNLYSNEDNAIKLARLYEEIITNSKM